MGADRARAAGGLLPRGGDGGRHHLGGLGPPGRRRGLGRGPTFCRFRAVRGPVRNDQGGPSGAPGGTSDGLAGGAPRLHPGWRDASPRHGHRDLSDPQGTTITYTTNGVDPTEGDSTYTAPLPLANVTLKARGWKSGYDGSPVKTASYTVTKQASLAAGGSHSLVLKSDGTVWAFGTNSNGQLGDGTQVTSSCPSRYPASVASWP